MAPTKPITSDDLKAPPPAEPGNRNVDHVAEMLAAAKATEGDPKKPAEPAVPGETPPVDNPKEPEKPAEPAKPEGA